MYCQPGRVPVERHVARGDAFTAAAAGPVMKLFQVRAQRRKTDNWLQHRKSAPRSDPRRRPPVYYTHRRPGRAALPFV